MSESELDNANSKLKALIGQSAPQGKTVLSVDGFKRDVEQEEDINNIMYAVFHTPEGQKALNYLRSITLNSPQPPGVNTETLLHKEGGRWLFGIIYSRFEKGKYNGRRTRSESREQPRLKGNRKR